MAKTASIGVRVEEELKNEAQKALDEMGIPMSLAIELFLKQVAEKRRLPFSIGPDDADTDAEREEQQRQFWQSFMTWYFDVWPRFDSDEVAKRAGADLGFTGDTLGSAARRYIIGDAETSSEMSKEQAAAYFEVGAMQTLLADAKELIYWALGMDKLFVPRLAARCADEADQWRWQRLWAKRADSMWGGHLAEVGILAADPLSASNEQVTLPDEKLMELCRDWLEDFSCEGVKWERLEKLAWETDDPDEMQEALEEAGLLDDFECYVMERGGEGLADR